MNWKAKLGSRKFWAMLANTVSQFAIFFGVANSQAERIASIIMTGGGFIAYMIAEGIADSKTDNSDNTTNISIERFPEGGLEEIFGEGATSDDDEEVG